MISRENFEFIRDTVFQTLEFECSERFELVEQDAVYVKKKKDHCVIGASSKILCARACMLYAKNVEAGKTEFEMIQKPAFKTCGVMLDMSRGGVMTVSAIKRYLDVMACLGLNMFMLYTEDIYEMEKYPYFGYMRGRYTAQELREVDDYADALGIEVIPCIQTLGHLGQYLKWNASAEVRNTGGTLLCGEPATYEFIEEMVKTMRSVFRSGRIHIGLDEATDANQGRYAAAHGIVSNFDVTVEHLKKIYEICSRYHFKPMMWDDMFIRAKSKTGNYYDPDIVVTEEDAEQICDVDMVYWDYDRISEESTEKFIKSHKQLGKNVILAGCSWTHGGHLPESQYSYATLTKQLPACIVCGVDEVMTTVWGDNGCEVNYFYTLPSLGLLSEHCYDAAHFTKDAYVELIEYVTKWDYKAYEALALYHEPQTYGEEIVYYTGRGKALFYTDILYNFTGEIQYWNRPLYQPALDVLAEAAKKKSKWQEHYMLALGIFQILETKRSILCRIRTDYENGNKEYFKELRDRILPELLLNYEQVAELMKKLWKNTNKAFGWEVIDFRSGGIMQRLKYAIETVDAYIEKDQRIEELEFAFIEHADLGYILNASKACSTMWSI